VERASVRSLGASRGRARIIVRDLVPKLDAAETEARLAEW
jgi:hypothetical protein